MRTSNFASHCRDPNAISIARSAPRWFKGPTYAPLAPPAWLLDDYKAGRIHIARYRAAYTNEVLDGLLARAVVADIHRLVPGEPILLCWEGPGGFCHRRLVAAWLNDELDMTVEDIVKPRRRFAGPDH